MDTLAVNIKNFVADRMEEARRLILHSDTPTSSASTKKHFEFNPLEALHSAVRGLQTWTQSGETPTGNRSGIALHEYYSGKVLLLTRALCVSGASPLEILGAHLRDRADASLRSGLAPHFASITTASGRSRSP